MADYDFNNFIHTVNKLGEAFEQFAVSANEAAKQFAKTIANSNIQIILQRDSALAYLQSQKSNNWLKLHGFPMKRKVTK